MYAFEQAIRPYIPVVAQTKQKVLTSVVPTPDIGIRWGKPSRFEFSNEEQKHRKQGPIAVEYLGKKEELRGKEVFRLWEKVKVAAKAPHEANKYIFERPKEIFFFTHEEEVYSEKPYGDGSNPNHIQPEITTIYHYVKFSFMFNSQDVIDSSGERGKHPDDILAATQAEFDATITGQNQKSKEYWEGVFEDIKTWSQPSWAGGPGAG